MATAAAPPPRAVASGSPQHQHQQQRQGVPPASSSSSSSMVVHEGSARDVWAGVPLAAYASEPAIATGRSSDPSAAFPLPRQAAASASASASADETTLWLREKFPDLPLGDTVLASYSCAMVKAILIQGRLYVTTSTLLFYARIFGRVTKEMYPLSTVRSAAPRKSGFVANAIKVKFLHPDSPSVIFGSLSRRERACALINARLLAVNPALSALLAEEEDNSPDEYDMSRSQSSTLAGSVRSNSTVTERGLPPRANGHARQGRRHKDRPRHSEPAIFVASRLRDDSESVTSSDDASSERLSYSEAGDEPDQEPRSRSFADVPISASRSNLRRDRNDVTSNGLTTLPKKLKLHRTPEDPVDTFSGNEFASRVEQARGVLNASVEESFNVLFDGDWLKHCHAENGNSEISQTDWERASDGYMTRTMTFNRALGYRIGPKSTRVVETHKYSFTSKGGVVVELNGHNLDAPFGDYFRVETYLEMAPLENNMKTSLVASVAVYFAKPSMLKSKIESGCLAETKVSFTRMVESAVAYLDRFASSRASSVAPDGFANGHSVNEMRESSSASSPRPNPSNLRKSKSERPTHRGGLDIQSTMPSSRPELASVAAEVPSSAKVSVDRRGDVNVKSTSPTVVELQEAPGSQTLRILAVVALVLISVMLLVCILMLVGLQADLRRVENLALGRLSDVTEKAASCATGTAS